MADHIPGEPAPNFFIIGPLRTGTSLLSRFLDDHPDAICLCESEINRALFRDYFVELHCNRMVTHGLPLHEAVRLLDRRRQDDVESYSSWYRDARNLFARIYNKPTVKAFGDKSPDLYRSPALVRHLAATVPLIYTVRDPRAIFHSIDSQDDATPADKQERWESLIDNYLTWKPHLSNPNILISRYEDLVASPETSLRRIYAHLGLDYSPRYSESFPRPFPDRFLWDTAIDRQTGHHKATDASRISTWKGRLGDAQVDQIRSNEVIREFMDVFSY